MNVADVTTRWVQLSGDPDFKYDIELFRLCIGLGSMAVSVFGLATAAAGIATVWGTNVPARYWIGLAVAAPLIHLPWFLYRVIATGTLSRAEAALNTRVVGTRLAAICLAYLAAGVWAFFHGRGSSKPARTA